MSYSNLRFYLVLCFPVFSYHNFTFIFMLFMVSCIFRDLILLNIIKLQGLYLCCHVITVIIKLVLQIQGILLQKRNKQPQKGLNSITSNIHKKMIAKHVNLKSQLEVSIVVCVICVLKNKIIIVFGLINV